MEEGHQGRPDVYVGIVDEGVDIFHAELAPNKFVNYWDPINGIDDDHNGYIDDRYGWDFYNNDNTVFDGKALDFIDVHGTGVAGEVSAVQNNTFGVSGIAPKVKYIPAKFLGPDGAGTTPERSPPSTTSPTSNAGTASTSSPPTTPTRATTGLGGAASGDPAWRRCRHPLRHHRRKRRPERQATTSTDTQLPGIAVLPPS